MYRDHSVAVVVPAYNEEGFVGQVIETMPDIVDRVYVVDDRSSDGTWSEIVRHALGEREAVEEPAGESWRGHRVVTPELAVTDGGTDSSAPTVVAIRHAENRGVGGAITTGYRRALDDGMDVTAVMAGDGQMDPDQLDRLLDPIVEGEAAYAKGNRLLGRDYHDEMSTFRLFGNLTLSVLTKIASGYWTMLDPQNGYTAISHEALETIDLDSLYEAYGFSNDLLVELNVHGLPVADVAMPAVYGDEQSHIEYHTFVPNLSWLLFRRFCRRLGVRYLLRDFHPLALLYVVGTLGTATALAGLAAILRTRAESESKLTRLLSTAILLVVSTTTLLLAMIYDREVNDDLVVSVR